MITKKTKKTLKFLEDLSGELSFGTLLSAIRQSERASQAAFAEELGISRQYLCDLEQGRRFPAPGAAADYAKKLGYLPQQFVRLCLQNLLDREGLNLIVDIKDAA